MGPGKKNSGTMIKIHASTLNYRKMNTEILAVGYSSKDFQLFISVCSKGLTLPKERTGFSPWLLDGNPMPLV